MIFSFSMCLVAPWRRATALMGRASSDTRSAHAEALVSVLPSRSSSTMAQASPGEGLRSSSDHEQWRGRGAAYVDGLTVEDSDCAVWRMQ